MAMITIPKTEYRKLLQTQREFISRLERLEKVIKESEPEIRPSILRRWEKFSKELDQGKGRYFNSIRELGNYLRNL